LSQNIRKTFNSLSSESASFLPATGWRCLLREVPMENINHTSRVITENADNPFRLAGLLPPGAEFAGRGRLLHIAEKLLGLGTMAEAYAKLEPSSTPEDFTAKVLSHLDISCEIIGGDLGDIPASGPTLIVANHPFGGIEGIAILHLLKQVRPDVKVMANSLLKRVPELARSFIGVNPYGGNNAARQNARGIREAVRWLNAGGLLVVFPAGDVSELQLHKMRIADGKWDAGTVRLARLTKASVLPLFIEGKNSHAFNLLGKIHPHVRTLMLPREVLNKRGQTVRIWCGKKITSSRLDNLGDDNEIARYLRLRSYMLPDAMAKPETQKSYDMHDPGAEHIISPVAKDLLVEEIARLPTSQKLAASAHMDVFYASAGQVPVLLQEIGRLREVTFRATGEGTGKSVDIDHYDMTYLHLILWDRSAEKIAGAYRLGLTDKILETHGKKGLYSQSLFKLRKKFIKYLNPAIELGRSFICAEYQKNPASLFLLWKGIGAFIVRNPHYAMLFGPVSISNDYSSMSQQLMVDFLKQNNIDDPLRKYIKSRNPYKGKLRPLWQKSDLANNGSLNGISELVSIIEGGERGVPVLMRHYLKIGGRILGFNVDQQFGNCVDGLVVVDLRETEQRILNRYMGTEGADFFLEHHNKQPLQMAS
jgi:putative hemolysin